MLPRAVGSPIGVLELDHRAGTGLDGKQGKLETLATFRCAHCDRIIAIAKVANDSIPLANVNIGLALHFGVRNISLDYTHKHTCRRCGGKGICRVCAAQMELNGGQCPGPWEAKVDHSRNNGLPLDYNHVHNYGKTSIPTG